MKRKHLMLLASIVLILGSIAFCIVGIVQSRKPALYSDLVAVGQRTFYAVNAGDEIGQDGSFVYFITYRTEDEQFEYIRYDVGREEYFDYQFDEEAGNPHKSLSLYVFTYVQEGEQQVIMQERAMTVEEVANIIDDSQTVTGSLRYFLFSGMLLLIAVYLVWNGFGRHKAKKTKIAENN